MRHLDTLFRLCSAVTCPPELPNPHYYQDRSIPVVISRCRIAEVNNLINYEAKLSRLRKVYTTMLSYVSVTRLHHESIKMLLLHQHFNCVFTSVYSGGIPVVISPRKLYLEVV